MTNTTGQPDNTSIKGGVYETSQELNELIFNALNLGEITIKLNKETTQYVKEKAKAAGLTVEVFIQNLITHTLSLDKVNKKTEETPR